jgi:hypothetical protein
LRRITQLYATGFAEQLRWNYREEKAYSCGVSAMEARFTGSVLIHQNAAANGIARKASGTWMITMAIVMTMERPTKAWTRARASTPVLTLK